MSDTTDPFVPLPNIEGYHDAGNHPEPFEIVDEPVKLVNGRWHWRGRVFDSILDAQRAMTVPAFEVPQALSVLALDRGEEIQLHEMLNRIETGMRQLPTQFDAHDPALDAIRKLLDIAADVVACAGITADHYYPLPHAIEEPF